VRASSGAWRCDPASLPNRIGDLLSQTAERLPDQLALIESSGSWTYRELEEAVRQTRNWLRENGVRGGDRVMIVSANCRAFVAIVFAISGLEAWPVPVNARLSAREIDEIRDHSEARLVLYTTAVSAQARRHAERHGARIGEIGLLGGIGIGPLNETAVAERTEQDGTSQIAVLLYTSGSTGRPKGVMLTHQNVLFMAATSSRIRSLTSDDRVYCVLPMSHIVAFSVLLLGTIASGATLVISPQFDPVALQRDVGKHRLTVLLGVPSMFALLLEYAKLQGIHLLKFPSLRIVSSSGAPLTLELKSEVERLFGLTLANGYGTTECSPTIAQVRPDFPRTDTSVGPPLPGVEVKLVGAGGGCVAEKEVGELWVRGPNVMKGYYRAPEETAAVISSDGWFNTRDLARIESGNLFIIGRSKELIVRFGFNVYPAEVENVLNGHPAVFRSAVVGRPAAGTQGDEEIVAFIECERGAVIAAAELLAYAARHLAPYKLPSQFVFVSEMPMTSTGKVRKAELAKLAESAAPGE
jgi:long-chain acyl-CoA synthetase